MKLIRPVFCIIVVTSFIVSCSSTILNESWKSPDHVGKIDSIYIIGVSKNSSTRRIFEDSFNKSFADSGVKGFVSYKDFPADQKADKDAVLAKVNENSVGSIMLTRMIKKETETVVNPGRVSTYSSGGGYYPSAHYRSYSSYYPRRYETVYEPPTVTQFEIATIESNIYDTASGELIWGARLETTIEGNHHKMIEDFIEVVTKDLKAKGLI